METVLILFSIQGLIGAFDNLWHHEITEDLTNRPEARLELSLHTVREFIYAVIFCSLAWYSWHGYWSLLLLLLLVVEIIITLWDFVIEDKTRKLPPFERILHTILALNFGVILAFFMPEILHWFYAPTAFAAADYGVLSWIMTAYGAGVFCWAVYDLLAVQRLFVPEWKRSPFEKGKKENPKTILITGATGFIGTALTRKLVRRGDQVIVLSRSAAKANYLFGPHVRVISDLGEIRSSEDIDAFINLAGEPVMGGLWTNRRKEKLIASRVQTTEKLVRLASRLARPPEVLINGSAIGYYGTRGEEELDEESSSQPHFMSVICQKWEKSALMAEAQGMRVCLLRIGLVFGESGGPFPALTRPFKLGLGAVFGHGTQWMSWIHISDLIRVIEFTLNTQSVHGPVNAVAPGSLTNEQFSDRLAAYLKRPRWFRIPVKLFHLGLGELADLFTGGQNVKPVKLLKHEFQFQYPELRDALSELVGGDGRNADASPDHNFYYNNQCPVCSYEINHYDKICRRKGLDIRFLGLKQSVEDLKSYGLTRDDLKRRVYVLNSKGQLTAGVHAFREVTASVPSYRWVSALLDNPLICRIAEFAYEGVLAPSLYRWSNRRERRLKGMQNEGVN